MNPDSLHALPSCGGRHFKPWLTLGLFHLKSEQFNYQKTWYLLSLRRRWPAPNYIYCT